jgi:serine/threonine protein kinase
VAKERLMKRKTRKVAKKASPMTAGQLQGANWREMLPPKVAKALTENRVLHEWVTDFGMMVLAGVMGADSQPHAAGGLNSSSKSSRMRPVPPSSSALEIVQGVPVGFLLMDKYRVERRIGSGGMGIIALAEHIHLKKKVAIKFLLPENGSNPENLTRFLREAQVVARIDSEHVAKVFDMGTLESGIPYIVMEYLEGHDLHELMQRIGAVSVAKAVDFILQACDAIAKAHAAGIVHRDLKPANLYCVPRPGDKLFVKVLDFGISKVAQANDSGNTLTQAFVIFGSPPYMSPEQSFSTHDVDERTDIWSLGIILYELLAGIAPFSAETNFKLRMKIANTPMPPLRKQNPAVPAKLEQIVKRCLEKEADARYQSVAELALALRPFADVPDSTIKVPTMPRFELGQRAMRLLARLALLFVMMLDGSSAKPVPTPHPSTSMTVGHGRIAAARRCEWGG